MNSGEELKFLPRGGFRTIVERLLRDYWVFGTKSKHGFPVFSDIAHFDDLELFPTPTHLSAKEFLFPQREPLVRFDTVEKTAEAVVGSRDQALVGLHPCDIRAISLMDRVFAYGVPDANYLARRKRTLIVGTDCFPDKNCFCASVGAMDPGPGYDLFLHQIKDGFLVRIGSEAGSKLLKAAKCRPPRPLEIEELKHYTNDKIASFETRLEADYRLLPPIYAKSESSPVWDKIGKICYGCGSCNHVCPTCYCFDVTDTISGDLKKVERSRTWDGCTQEEFAVVSGGHNFRATRADRLKHRFNRKFNYLFEKYGELFCVGCGRCSRTCLVNINIADVTNELIREFVRK
jgi:ferredoxin